MSVRFFRSFHGRFTSAMFAPRKPRHPALRALLGVVGVLLLAVLLVAGVFVGLAMLAGGLVARLLRRRGKPQAAAGRVVDAEYHVVPKAGEPLLR
ncbi:hypothetical protein [Luteimonas lutimaris]|uniref:Uncharacterized protein n=1 Tax=Luteimonas lutimaris TaxID=698645 RepID=A0ABP7MAK3_9GAMM